MTKREAKKLQHGIYRIHWKMGGSSLASLGSKSNGDKWIAATNWISGSNSNCWRFVDKVEFLMSDT